ncbi:low affinity iron permease family protein [Streptomyces resistomycificus]|uniref:low affinity iron permease family protein n=1 Tax=Streptomyces resistomycificus TaxID=67356 RepID=UPI0004AB536B|nr:low affinity iron permease family protein [Streptomyces resistomycificus]
MGFERLAENASRFTSSATFFGICLILVAVAVALHVIGLPIAWLLFVGEAMSAVTLLMVALLKNSELRAERAVQRKLDLIAAALLEGLEGGGPGEAHQRLRSLLDREEKP